MTDYQDNARKELAPARKWLLLLLAMTGTAALIHRANTFAPWLGGIAAVVWGLSGPPGVVRFPRAPVRQLQMALYTGITLTASVIFVSTPIEWRVSGWEADLFAAGTVGVMACFLAAQARRWLDLPPVEVPSALAARQRFELAWLKERRAAVQLALEQQQKSSLADLTDQPKDLVGLALSGGGIRAASVALGFVYGLAQRNRLWRADYMSTVSGGGWLGAALLTALADGKENLLYSSSGADWKDFAGRFAKGREFLGWRGWQGAKRVLLAVGALTIGALTTVATLALLAAVFATFLLWGTIEVSLVHPEIRTFARNVEAWPEKAPGRFLFRLLFENHVALEALDVLPLAILGLAALIGPTYLIAALARLRDDTARWAQPLGSAARGIARSTFGALIVLLFLHGLPAMTALVAAVPAVWFWALTGRPQGKSRPFFLVVCAGSLPWVLGRSAWLYHKWYGALLSCLFWIFRVAPLNRLLGLPLAQWSNDESDGRWNPQFGNQVNALQSALLSGVACAVLFVLFGFVARRLTGQLQKFWQDQIREGLLGHGNAPKETFSSLAGKLFKSGAPLPILNGAALVPGSSDPILQERGSLRFEMSPLAVGGPHLGWRSAAEYDPYLTLATAVAVSAAAVNPQAGRSIPSALRVPMALANVRLGVWLPNPLLGGDARFPEGVPFQPQLEVDELFNLNDELDPLVYVGDGGFEDNLGISALVERGCKLVISLDATSDPSWLFDDLEALPGERDITTKWLATHGLRPASPQGPQLDDRVPNRPAAHLRFAGPEGSETRVLYVKAAVTQALLAATGDDALTDAEMAYVKDRKRFPQQTTADQWFSEPQIGAYIKVGRALAKVVDEELEGDQELKALFEGALVAPAQKLVG